MKNLRKYLSPGVLGIAIYLLIRLITDSHSMVNVWMKRSWQINFIELVGSVIIGYLFSFIMNRVQKKYDQKLEKNLKAGLLFRELGELFLFTLVGLNLTATILVATTDDGLQLADFVVINTIPVIVILLLHTVYRSKYYLNAYVSNRMLLQKIQNDKLTTELEFLKGQYHPHFLFNALNTVYFQMDESKDKAKSTIEKLSELLRYQLYEDQQTKISIEKELEFIDRYLALQKERLPEIVSVDTNWELVKGEIYPMLLMPLVENACKYVSGEKPSIHLVANRINGNFVFEVSNSMQMPEPSIKENGIGLSHLKRRLNLLYEQNYVLEADFEDDCFKGKLTVPV